MTARLLALGSWLALAAATLLLGAAVSRATTAGPAQSAAVGEAITSPRPPVNADSVAQLVVARDVFRTERRASLTPYAPNVATDAADEEPVPRPRLRLLGLITGGGSRALIEGFPGTPGARLVGAGERVAGIRVVAIAGRSVRLAGLDTTWTLTLERRQ